VLCLEEGKEASNCTHEAPAKFDAPFVMCLGFVIILVPIEGRCQIQLTCDLPSSGFNIVDLGHIIKEGVPERELDLANQ